ncbi:MAG: TonB-dependent receptor, partial [bacterium]|nr:TonB-dependent receptor [Candidatus Kapabacteria bacterium]
MPHRIFRILIAIVLTTINVSFAYAQTDPRTDEIRGVVRSTEDDTPVSGATIRVAGTDRGAIARSDGSFAVRGIPPGEYTLSVSSIGFETIDTTIVLTTGHALDLVLLLAAGEHETEEVVVTGTRTQRTIDDVPVRVEAVPQEEVEEKLLMSPSNVSVLLNESQGMRVQTTSPTTATANLRIQGLPGRYTQLLTDGIPNVGGLSAGFGLTELPPLNLRQVEIIKGAASALYGADAIAGVVNFITKDPRPELELSALVNVTSQKAFDLAAYAGKRFDDFGFTIMASRNVQPRYDVDGDDFADVTEVERYTIYPKLQYAPSDDVSIEVTGGYISDDRL